MSNCTLAEYVTFTGDTILDMRRPKRANLRTYETKLSEYDTPNGGTVLVPCTPVEDVRDLIFEDTDYYDLYSFYLAHRGKVFVYTNHYLNNYYAVFIRGPIIVERKTDCLHDIQITLRCFAYTESD